MQYEQFLHTKHAKGDKGKAISSQYSQEELKGMLTRVKERNEI